jgi:hypothetical protein
MSLVVCVPYHTIPYLTIPWFEYHPMLYVFCRQYRLDVTGKLVHGKNTVAFVFKSSAEEAVRRAKAYPYKVPYVAVRRCSPDPCLPFPSGDLSVENFD